MLLYEPEQLISAMKKELTKHLIPLGLFFVYSLGFIILNIYLAIFGIFEFNFLQTRFLSTGLFASLIAAPLFLVVYKVFSTLAKKYPSIKGFFSIFMVYFSALFIVVYSILIFPTIPQFIGGASPVSASIIGSPDEVNFLKNFDLDLIPNAEGLLPVQTAPACILYQNDGNILLGVEHDIGSNKSIRRVVYLKKDQYRGLQLRGGATGRKVCRALVFYDL